MKEIQHKTKRTPEPLQFPNLVKLQTDSYDWFLKEGLKELFQSFSPIHDFTGNLSLELLDYVLGDPKYSVEECRYRDMTTYEAPIKAKVRLTQAEKEVIESEVYLGDLPLMTEKGTFVINGAERVVVSQLARSPGVYFKDTLDYSGRVLYFATIIPSPGAWIDVETDPSDVISVHVAQTRKFPLTTFLRVLNMFPSACPTTEMLLVTEAAGKALAANVVNKNTGEIIFDAGTIVDEKVSSKLHRLHIDKVEVDKPDVKSGTTTEILDIFSTREVRKDTTAESIKGLRPVEDITDAKTGKILVKAGEKISDDVAKKIEKLSLSSLEVYVVNKFIDATLAEDSTSGPDDALIDIYKRIRPGDPATRDSAISLMNSYFFDTRRYDLARVGRYKLNKKLGLSLPERVRAITRDDIIKIITYIIALSESGSLITHFNGNNLGKRLPELKEAITAQEASASEEDLEIGGRVYKFKQNYAFLESLKFGGMFTEGRLKEVRKLLELIPNGNRLVSDTPAELYAETAMRLVACSVDDIDHLENKRIRSVGELLQDQLRMGFLRMEKVAKERMTSLDADNVIPQVVLSVKPISASIKSFFGSSQLSQFMDQTNPLAELTHKRRLSALGPGGLSRQSAKLEVRDVHHSHYGRICPIETPEGPNIGLIGSMAIHAKIDEYGFLRTPYRVVKSGKVTSDDLVWMSADEESQEYVAPANTPYDEETGEITLPTTVVRHESTYPQVASNKVTYMEVSPMQIMSVAASLIPFLENDDANRALMGSNMQRQSVPLLRADSPIVRTGIEARAARDSGAVVIAKRAGIVRTSTAEKILIEAEDGTVDEYRLINMLRSNQGTCITQKPIVTSGKRVRQGDILADGPCTENGELALGQNVLVAYMPWNGYNYEDAVLLSQRLVKDDVYSSIHIEKYETEARDTKLGPEEITRDIPNVGEDVLKDLDSNGIIRVGADVRPEDILVGKVAPKGQGELTAEERLIIAIFGKKAEETRDVSLRVPHGETGTIVDVKVFSRFKFKCSRCGAIFDFSKKPEKLLCERCDGELMREPGDELPAGVNQLVRVYIAQKRKIMEGDKMAGRHGNKGVISKVLPESDMPYLPDGTPVDIVLNPLGVPSRMNIGQILETHQGYVGHHLKCNFKNPIFQGATEAEIRADMEVFAWKLRLGGLRDYVRELELNVSVSSEREVDLAVKHILAKLGQTTRSDMPALLNTIESLYNNGLQNIENYIKTLDAADLEILSIKLGGPTVVEDPISLRLALSDALKRENEARIEADKLANGLEDELDSEDEETEEVEEKELVIPYIGANPPADYDYSALIRSINENVQKRCGYDEKRGKCALYDGRTGQKFSQEVTIGYVYMLKLHHLVEDKIHARSTGPYSLVTQQPLGGKAQFGGQRFGEMEVWALEAYGAAYTLQEILTIKSDDVTGRVKTYESIVKGESIMEPGVPESFKILINELQSLCLKVSVEDDRDRIIDLKDAEEESSESRDGGVVSARRRKKVLELKENFNG